MSTRKRRGTSGVLSDPTEAMTSSPLPRKGHTPWNDPDLGAAPSRVKRLLAAVEKANEVCRSAYQVASRGGAETNWPAGFMNRLKEALDRQHKIMHPDAHRRAPKTIPEMSDAEIKLAYGYDPDDPNVTVVRVPMYRYLLDINPR